LTAHKPGKLRAAGTFTTHVLLRRIDLTHRSGPVDEDVTGASRDVLRGDENVLAVSHRCGVVTQRPSSCSFAGAQLRQLPESSPLCVRADAPPLLAAVRELERSEPGGPVEP
jgi:hypothetical protein